MSTPDTDTLLERLDALDRTITEHLATIAAHKSELEARLRQGGLATPEAIADAFERMDPVRRDALARENTPAAPPAPVAPTSGATRKKLGPHGVSRARHAQRGRASSCAQ